jgi:NAD(P)-dependent dehydrogenase (short-subunit alcohol dehydrogenase family)
MASSFDLTNEVALVTGASRGIGLGLAAALARAGLVTGTVLPVDAGWTAQ